ncbi:MAG: DUF2142 domain-containing protein [Nitriliruptorales bacterium]|nr:DUF2142 domain-containing protein [Nitriliruptorales bacterium]
MTMGSAETAERADEPLPDRRTGAGAARGEQVAVGLLVALCAALLIGYSVLAPTYRAPDELMHVDMALAVSRGEAWPWPDPDGRRLNEQILRSLEDANFADPTNLMEGAPSAFRASEALPRDERPSVAEIAPPNPTDLRNQMPQHPPAYYLLGGGMLTALGAEAWSFDRMIGALRLLSIALVAPLPLYAYLTARRLTGDGPTALGAAALALAVPQLLHIGSVVNNDALLISLFGVITVLIARVLTDDDGWWTAMGLGLVSGLALLTKGFALAVYGWIFLAYAAAAIRARERAQTVLAGAAALALAAATGGWWWLRNLVRYGDVQPTTASRPPARPEFTPDLGAYADHFWRFMNQRFWGSFGWVQVPLDWWIVWTATSVLLTGMALAFLLTRSRARASRMHLAVLLLPVPAIIAIVLSGSLRVYIDHGSFAGVQGRYLFPAAVGLAAVASTGYAALLGRNRRWLPLLLLLAAGAAQVAGTSALLHGFWMAPAGQGPADAVAAVLSWSPWPAAVVVSAAITALVAGIAVGAYFLTLPWRSDRPAGEAGWARARVASSPDPHADNEDGAPRVGSERASVE